MNNVLELNRNVEGWLLDIIVFQLSILQVPQHSKDLQCQIVIKKKGENTKKLQSNSKTTLIAKQHNNWNINNEQALYIIVQPTLLFYFFGGHKILDLISTIFFL